MPLVSQFGFGWEAVNVFVLLSGLSLAISLGHSDRPSSWPSWIAEDESGFSFPFTWSRLLLAR